MTNLKKTQVYFDPLKSFPKNVDCANIMEGTEYEIWHYILPEAVEEFGGNHMAFRWNRGGIGRRQQSINRGL